MLGALEEAREEGEDPMSELNSKLDGLKQTGATHLTAAHIEHVKEDFNELFEGFFEWMVGKRDDMAE